MPTPQDLLTSLGAAITELQAQITTLQADKAALQAQVVALQAQVPPTGIVKIVITDVDMSKVTFS